ncbi:MAG TPA: peptidyl-prolyl cis-trans isomerase [Candidatus Acidoferrales bacterium]|jgi:peptidyl-prolyl cis-trans isomerase SurA|nr:peptidyl-prolyl cis-trans isomerase [Candidatus Acidoferrales bacterium]
MKFFRSIPVLAVVVCAPVLARAEAVDGIKAVVADRVITFAEVEDITRPAVDSLRRQYAGQPDIFDQKLNQALTDSTKLLVERALILHSFEADGYHLPDGIIEQAIQDRIRDRFGDRVTLMKSLQQQGMTYEQFRKSVRDQYIENAMRNQNVQREVVVSPYKIQTYYKAHTDDFKLEDQVKLRMIVLNKTSDTDTNTLALAREIQSKLKEGATFSDMAAVYSQGSQQHQGGDWGWVERSVLRKELADVAFSLAPGQVGDPIDTPDAVYVMLVEEKKAAAAKPLADVRSDIEKTLRAQQQADLQKNWIDGLAKKTFVRYLN